MICRSRWATLCCHGRVPAECSGVHLTVFGELSLDGSVRPVRGALPMVISALERGEEASDAADGEFERGSLHRGHFPLSGRNASGGDSASDRSAGHSCRRSRFPTLQLRGTMSSTWRISSTSRGRSSAKRALEIAAAGGHNVLLIGPPGSGKTLMARCMPSILPDMTFSEALETTRIHSVAGYDSAERSADRTPVSIAASHRFARVAGRRRQQRPARRNQQSAQWRFTVLCNALRIAIINKKASGIRQLFVNTACFFPYYVHLIPVPEFLANGLKMNITP